MKAVMKMLFPLVLCIWTLPALGQTPDLAAADACLPRVLAMNEIARGWQQRALAAEAELAKMRAQAELVKARVQADRVRLDALASQSSAQPSSASAPSEYAPYSNSSTKTEHVSGYVRKDGTVVQPYMRHPRSR
jgi:hypothetical protein